jgi:hypothetical protein
VPIRQKNIVMYAEIASASFPGGDIDLRGRDW